MALVLYQRSVTKITSTVTCVPKFLLLQTFLVANTASLVKIQ